MKKIVCISGIITVFLCLIVLTGWMDADEKVQKSLREGNDMYESEKYAEALRLYETGLGKEGENTVLNFNAAQAAYLSGDYEKAVLCYENAEDCTDKYLNFGNIYYMAGESASEADEKVQLYAQALQIYMDGIMKYPQEVSLKYNYETVKAKIEELLEEEESEQESEGESGSESEDEQSESEQSDSQSEDEQSESEQSESESHDGDDDQQEEYSQGEEEDESEADMEAVERILAMLESQEEESLKNNQEVVGGNDNANGW